MSRRGRWIAGGLGVLVGVPLVLILGLLVGLNTGPGRRAAERLTGRLSHGQVTLGGLHGGFPQALRLDRLELRDRAGVWLSASDVALDWSPLALIGGRAAVGRLSAAAVEVRRLPVAGPTPKPAAAPFRLPVAVEVDRLIVDRLILAAPVAGAAAILNAAGAVHLRTLSRGQILLTLQRLDRPGRYTLEASATDARIDARVQGQEPAFGLIAGLARLPTLAGAIGIDATLAGPWRQAGLHAALAAGALRANAGGTLDLERGEGDLTVRLDAPAMAPAPGLAWGGLALAARVQGPFARPAAQGTLSIQALEAGGASVGGVTASIAADTRTGSLDGVLRDVRLPAPNQTLLAGGPVQVTARIRLDDPRRPVTFGFRQAVIQGDGTATLAPGVQARLVVSVPDLTPIAAARGREVHGAGGFTLAVAEQKGVSRIDLDAALDVTGGASVVAGAIGRTTLGATVTLDRGDIVLSRLKLDGTSLHAEATGARRGGLASADWRLDVADLRSLVPAARGRFTSSGHLAGTQTDFAVSAALSGQLGNAGLAPVTLSLTVQGNGLPERPAGRVQGTARLAGAALSLDLSASRDAGGGTAVRIERADWKSAQASGALLFGPGAALPSGTLRLAMARLGDLAPLLGRPVAGAVVATVDLPAGGAGRVHVAATGLRGLGAAAAAVVLDAAIADPAGTPRLAGRVRASGLEVGAARGEMGLTANGKLNALAVTLAGQIGPFAGAQARLDGAGRVDVPARRLRLERLSAGWQQAVVALAGPATIDAAGGVAVDRLRLTASAPGAAAASVVVAGRVTPTLALTLAASDVTPGLARPFAPGLEADGVLHAEATLGGSLAAPTGSVRLTGSGLRLRRGAGRALPAVQLGATAALAGSSARVEVTAQAGAGTHLTASGQVPLGAAGALALRVGGAVDLALLDPVLTAQGRRVRGTAILDGAVGGTAAAPVVTGTVRLADGELQDYGQGIRISGIAGVLTGDGASLSVRGLSGRAGGGTVGLSGSVGLRAPMAVALRLVAENARPIASDLVTATVDADLRLSGAVQTGVAASGSVHVRRADIQVPDRLPSSVAVLDVRRPGERRVAAPAPAVAIPLDIALSAPQQIFVRGHGLDAELGGTLHLGGTAAAPQTLGAIELRRGSFSLAGQTLTFTSGTIGFNGAARIDPSLDLVATAVRANVTATLTVGGTASAPKITLTSVPDLPQDEILAQLLFGQGAAALSPFQLAQIAGGLAQISGVGGGGPDPVARLRRGLGLDRLSVGSEGTGNSATTALEAGRYVAPGVFLGAKQGLSGSQTQAEVQIDLTKGLKLNTDIGSGTGGNNVGLTYQFQY